jgi:hypothetical protein
MTAARGDVADVERYEQLRSHALEGGASGFKLGLVLLERRGVAAWTQAWSSAAPASTAAAAPVPTTLAPAPASGELVDALASMALARVAAG